ncbi:TlpA family protein disulfide reductase [Selenomonas sp. KH1T6]|uniref:TlpA family protein disulfide reductase n=1 Tax=Selenomonas sp. KH1T6 TaxID=3158784 RepID=UPI0008A7726B|nr:hypothetical protein SAMN05216583_10712 [Selenomonas ruminantium]
MTKQNLQYFLPPLILIILLFAIDISYLSPINPQPAASFPPFHTKDLNGQEFDESIFHGHLTLVCLWVTKDNSSAKILEALAEWQRPEGNSIQLLGIAGDLKDDAPVEKIVQARSITRSLPSNFPQLLTNDSLFPFLSTITKAPTFIFVNEQGQITGQPIAGWEMDLIKKEARRILSADSPETQQKNHLQSQLLH